ncbi:hypothetical protein X740_15725 [Mesorhizobium sp. LNHC221B00]|nr:hypothetical protein X740_15725 [Mesorhizobium sp. LNHC221B00]
MLRQSKGGVVYNSQGHQLKGLEPKAMTTNLRGLGEVQAAFAIRRTPAARQVS